MIRLLACLLAFLALATQSRAESPTELIARSELINAFDPAVPFEAVTSPPKLNEERRPWVDPKMEKAIVGTLLGRDSGKLVIERADGRVISFPPNGLRKVDRNYAWQKTEPRVDLEATVFLGRVNEILDGDTIQFLKLSGDTVNVRLDGIDAPESDQELGEQSEAELAKIKNKIVRIEFRELDNYNRPLADIYLGSRWINYELALSGHAYHYIKYNNDMRLMAAEDYSRKQRRGVWSVKKRVYPWDWRNGVREPTEDPLNVPSIKGTDTMVFVTESGTSYHCESCRYAKAGIEIPLSRAKSAYKACEICDPDVNAAKDK